MYDKPTALITGGAQRLGKALTRTFHQLGYDIALHYNNSQQAAIDLKSELESTREDSVTLYQCDLTNTEEVIAFSEQVAVKHTHLKLLINNSGQFSCFKYDMNNNIPLADYFFDAENTFQPEFSRISHLGPLERENDEANGAGIRYKIKITEHLNNILLRDSTNVKLGLAVSGNINLESNTLQKDLLSENDNDKVPSSSIVSPRGTVLYGNNTLDEDKKLYLEVFFLLIFHHPLHL